MRTVTNQRNREFFLSSSNALKIALLFFIFFLFTIPLALAPPTPHTVTGRVMNNDTINPNGVPNGIIVIVNNTATHTFYSTQVSAPAIPALMGGYSLSVSGEDGDRILLVARNSTHWGISNTTLLPTTTLINITLNRTRGSEPNVTILLPPNLSVRNTSSSFNLSANVTVLVKNGTDCNATISFSDPSLFISDDQNITNSLGDLFVGGPSKTTTWNLSGKSEGIANATVSVRCSTDQYYFEGSNAPYIQLTILDTSPPEITLIGPPNISAVLPNATLLYNVTDNTGLKNCSLVLDSVLNQSVFTPPRNTRLNFSLNDTPEGYHQWYVSCFDNGSSTLGANSSFFLFFSDGSAPNVTLIFPTNNSEMKNYSLLFTYNVTDNFNATNCTFSINSLPNQINSSINLGYRNNFSRVLPGGDYNWSVNCSDSVGNLGHSGTFRLLSSDLSIIASHLSLSNSNPTDGQLIIINATFRNIGSSNTSLNASALLFEYDPLIGYSLLLNQSINISASSNLSLAINYTSHVGTIQIVALIDPDLSFNGSIIESREDNNIANVTISIPPYHIFYGDILSEILLSSSQSSAVFAWRNSTNFGGNVYVADSDSTLDFLSLLPLGRNASYNETINDFSKLDLALNTTNLTDSINSTFTLDGQVIETLNFTVYSRFLTDVPIINSTNSSHFVTGILWDSSDSTTGNYSGNEDVVFFTRMNKGAQGRYGSYDYEIKLPANLERYKIPNLANSVSFYRELD